MLESTLISVVVPVFKAEKCIEELYKRLEIELSKITPSFEIILVEDCGGDDSWPLIEKIAAQDNRVRGIQFSRNFGQHYGITAGLNVCVGDWAIVMDCDLQDRPEEISRLYAKALEGYDVVVARRGLRNDPAIKRLTSQLFYKLFSYLADMNYDGQTGNFRIISRKVIDTFCNMNERLRFFGGLVAWMGFRTASIDVRHDGRFAGQTSYTFLKLWKLAIDTIIAYSDKPLRLTIRLGFFISALSMGYGSYIIYKGLVYGAPVMGWASMIVSLYFIGGIIISTLGVLGVYVGKTFDEVKRRPLYIISRTTYNG